MNRFAITLSAALLGLSMTSALAHDYKLGDLVIDHPVARATLPDAPVSGGYMTIHNSGAEADRLVSGEAAFAGRVEIHEMSMEGEVMKMRQLAEGLEIPAGGDVELKPGGYHIMFIDLEQQLAEGDKYPVTLVFEKAGSLEVEFYVETLQKMQGHDTMDHGTMDHGTTSHGG
ncbi:copper chaperone PCu(A)C [Hoeflea sp. YIM 152468]|uniref:copper chaperone PCu(A)C n=1 Tax=Hoeflea sp. YIM 152468 TaxID=3031759 RepID=UPI0023DBB3E7|nr:copper chaperone PCu(A)C [Hoeflea sp. YIM 152468]MDF1608535.1 copper chaperone PCu(A)C [Hoeflea sp. YIM 152468]